MKRKVITAIFIAIITVVCLYFGEWFMVGFASIIGIGGIVEIVKNVKVRGWHPAVKAAVVVGAVILLYWSFIMSYIDGETTFPNIPYPYTIRVNLIGLLGYLTILLILEATTKKFMVDDVFYMFTMSAFIMVPAQGLISLRINYDVRVIAYIFIVAFGCDIAAQLCGMLFGKNGKHKFAPITSPHKTWEGAIGGVAIATIIGTALCIIFPFSRFEHQWLFGFIMSLILAIAAVMGDLIFSSIKRQQKIKDFSDILPGHGGILDRFDSVLFVTLIFIIANELFAIVG